MRTRMLMAAAFISLPLAALAETALSLDWVLKQVEQKNPSIHSATAELAMKRGEAQSARAYPDPLLSYEWMDLKADRFDLSNAGKRRLELSQTLPFPGRTWLAGKEADFAVARSEAMLRQVVEDRVYDAKAAYFDMADAALSLAALQRAREAAEALAKASASRGRFGRLDRMGQLMDAMLGMQSGELASMQPHYEQARRMAEGKLNSLMGVEASRALPDPDTSADDIAATPAWKEEEVWRQAMMSNPMILEARHHLAHAQASQRRALAGWLPDLMLEAGFEEDAAGLRDNTVKAGMSLPYVWFWGQAGRAKAAAAEQAHAEAESNDHLIRVREMVRSAVGELSSSLAELKLLREKVLPQADQALAQAVEGYRSGVVQASDALDAVRGYWSAYERHAHLVAHAGQALAEVERLMGLRTSGSAAKMSH